jgi:hypothetical protein
MPRLEACYFGAVESMWWRLARVLAYTAAEHCTDWQVQVRPIVPPRLQSALGIPSHVHNTQKMEHWHRIITEAADGECLLLMDADTMILRPLDDVWTQNFDLGYTTKETRFPFNSGVVFVRVSPRVRAFVSEWRAENLRMLGDARHHQVWRKQYGGINQAALGSLLARPAPCKLTLAKLPCLEWNCEDSHWATFDPAVTRIVHIKGALRRAVFFKGHDRPPEQLAPLVERWHALEHQAVQAGARSTA